MSYVNLDIPCFIISATIDEEKIILSVTEAHINRYEYNAYYVTSNEGKRCCLSVDMVWSTKELAQRYLDEHYDYLVDSAKLYIKAKQLS